MVLPPYPTTGRSNGRPTTVDGLPTTALKTAETFAREHEAIVEEHHRIDKLPNNVDAVYATRWQTMGEPKVESNWQDIFKPYKVTSRMMAQVSKPSGTIFMHDLPAVRGGDVDDEVLDGPWSRAFRQARHKMTSAMAILEWCAGGITAGQCGREAKLTHGNQVNLRAINHK